MLLRSEKHLATIWRLLQGVNGIYAGVQGMKGASRTLLVFDLSDFQNEGNDRHGDDEKGISQPAAPESQFIERRISRLVCGNRNVHGWLGKAGYSFGIEGVNRN